MINYALKFRQLRKYLNCTQKQLAENLHVSRSVISQIEIGKFKPQLENIEDIARIYCIDPTFFFDDRIELNQVKEDKISRTGLCDSCIDKERVIKSLEKTIEAQSTTIRTQESILKILNADKKQTGSE